MPRVAIVILNWNGQHMLERFLPSVVGCCPDYAEVIIADNGSTDGSLAFLAERYPSLRVIALDRNYGFAGGYNRALAQVDADYYVLLNDDVEVTHGWIDPIVDLMESDSTIGLAQPKLMMYDCRDTFEYSGASGGFIDSYGYPFCRGRLFSTLETDSGQYDDTCDVFWASGAAMFVRASLWQQLGGLDDDFFAHMEEIDFCWRAHHAGQRAVCCPQSVVYHVGGGTLPKSSPRKTYLNFRNNLSMLYKNLPERRLHATIAMRLLLDGVAALRFLMQGHPKELSAVWRAHRDFRRQLPQLRVKRQAIEHHEIESIYRGHLLVDYYLMHRRTYSQLRDK